MLISPGSLSLLLPFSGVTFALGVPWLLFGLPTAMQKEALPSFFTFLLNRSKERMFHGQHNPPQSASALDDVGPDIYHDRHAGRVAGSLTDPTGEQYPRLAGSGGFHVHHLGLWQYARHSPERIPREIYT